jgi:hypothetical protein
VIYWKSAETGDSNKCSKRAKKADSAIESEQRPGIIQAFLLEAAC